MNRLQSELHRLYLPAAAAGSSTAADAASLIDAGGLVRAMVLELVRPANWEALSKVWRGIQLDLELPAPAVAVSGSDGLQLWFSLSEPVSVPRAHAFLECLRLHFLPDIAPPRVRQWPVADASAPGRALHTRLVPEQQEQTGNWSAFLAPDLAPVFADTPWLDVAPSTEGQADLLARLDSIELPAFEAAVQRLKPATPPPGAPESMRTDAGLDPTPTTPTSAARPDPKHFLLQVMSDDTVPLALRIEAAKALLPYPDK
jgi:hypothetical protein